MDLLDEEIEREAAEASTSRQSSHHDNDSDFMNREATEVEILMNHRVRISRTRRMNWYLDYHDCYITLNGPDTTGKKPFHVAGAVTKDGDKLEPKEEFKISSTTTCLFFSRYYKMSFILDFSPSVFVADGVGDILYTNMMPCVEKMLKELVYQFKFSNSKNIHKAEIYVTLIAYSPLIHFRKPPILVHGFRVTDSTLEDFLTVANVNAKAYLNDLLEYMLPINLQKEKNQIKISKKIGESRRMMRHRSGARSAESDASTPAETEEPAAPVDEEEVVTAIQPSTINDKIAIDFRLIQMLRLGMLGLYSAPETSQPGIVIITDGILYIPNQEVIQSIALNLRTNCIPLHFIEITSAGCGASPGYIPSSDLLSFLAQVSYGNHIRHKELLSYKAPDGGFINKFQRIMLSWSCQRGTYEMEDPLPSCANHPGRIRKQVSRIKSNFYQLFHVRIREGYFLKSLNVIKKGSKDYISALLTFPWTFDCRIDYQISAVYNDCDERIHDVHRVVTIETNYAPPDPITDPRDSALTAALFLSEAEKFAIKILSFSAVPDNYEIGNIPFHRYPSLYGFTQESYPFPTLIIKRNCSPFCLTKFFRQLEKTKFNGFWEPLVLADNQALHRCSHTLTMRFTTFFAENQKPSTNFWPEYEGEEGERNPTDFPAKNYLLNTLFEYFKATTTFCLVARYCYVKIVREGMKSPEYCYLVKIFADSTLLTIKVIFVGDCSLDVRNKTVGKIRNDLMKIDKLKGMLQPMATGVDAKMIKYHRLPEELYELQPLAMPQTSEIGETRQKLHQHTLLQIMRPRRIIYKMEKEFDDSRFGEIAIEGMNLIVRKRILEGYRVAFVENEIVHMVKEIASENYCIPPRVEQFILFPPHKKPITLKGASVQQLREQLAAVGKVLQIQKPEGEEEEEALKEAEAAAAAAAASEATAKNATENKENKEDEKAVKDKNPEIEIEFVKDNSEHPDDETAKPEHDKHSLDGGGENSVTAEKSSDKVVEVATSEGTSEKPEAGGGAEKGKKEKKKRKKGKKKAASKEEDPTTATATAATKEGEGGKKASKDAGKEGAVEENKEKKESEEKPEEVYDDSGCFIVSEYWMEPTTYLNYEDDSHERLQHAIHDRAMLSALITFRSMQCELNRAPGIGTALIGGEPYSLHVDECGPVNIAKNINYHAHLYSLVKMCQCGERLLVLMPTMKYIHSDPHSINRLGRILDSFNHEMRNYMPQCFDFEDTNGAWQTLAAGLEVVLEEVDQNELIEAEQLSLKDYDTDVERVMDETEDSTGSGTGYSTPAYSTPPTGLASPISLSLPLPAAHDSCASLTSQMAKMDDETLRKHVLGSYNKRGIFGSGESLNVPKSPSEQRSTSVPLPQENDDDQAEFLPSKGKKLSPSIQPPASAPILLSPKAFYGSDSERDKESVKNEKDSQPPQQQQQPKSKKTKKRKKKQQQNLNASTMSLTSFDRTSERSRRRAREDASDQAPLAFYVYYKRRDPKTIIVVMVPATCRAVLKITNKLVPRLPVLAFMIEEDKMFEIFRHSMTLPNEFKKTNFENFCVRSALAHLNWQVNAKLSESERETPSPASLFAFETLEGIDPTFSDLNDFCVNIMHDLVFSRAYAQAAYHCLGTNVHVPQTVLEEVLQEHCTQTSVTFGSIRDVLRVTCTHLSSYLQSKRVSRYKRHQMPNISSISSSSSSESEIEIQQVNEYQLMNPFCYSEAENDEICKMEQTEFRLAFENVLRQHKFFKVPAFADYYFYWPNGENTVQLFNSGGTWNEHLDDGAGATGNNSSKNNEESSDDSAVTLVSQDGASSSDEELDFDIQPLFLQFYISVPRSDGDIYSYSVDFIPNCLQDVIGRCDTNFFTADEKKALNEFNVEVEMFVLTVPSVDAIERPDERLRRTTEETIDWMLSREVTPVEDINLPPRERDIVTELKKGINHMLKTEQILILSRYFDSQKSYKNICHVVDFVESEASRNDEHTRVQTAQSDMLFVTRPEEGLRRLCARLEGSMISYCKIRCVRDEKGGHGRPIVFYCCSVEDFDTFCVEHKATADLVKFDFKPKKKQRVVTSEGMEDSTEEDTTEDVTETSTLINPDEGGMEDDSLGEDEVFDYNLTLKDSTNNLDEKVKRKQIVHDFWLIAKVESDPMRIRSFFFQRPNGVHDGLFKKFTDLLIEHIKAVNQALLLEELHETKECSQYLIDDEKLTAALTPSKEQTPLSEFASKYVIQPKLPPNEENDDIISLIGSSTAMFSQDSETEMEPVTYKYSPGYFFCPLVWHRWYSINPRLRQSNVDLGLLALRTGLENIGIRNRKNVYVFKESNGNIFYMYLFATADSANKVIADNSEEWQKEISANIQNNVLFAVFGIHSPSEEVTVHYANMLQKRIDLKLLDELQKSILKNPQLRLRQTDINFIQPNPSQPASILIYSLPAISKDYLASIFTYLQQHLSSYFIKPQFSDDPMASEPICFKPYPFDGGDEPLAPEYEGIIYLINKPKAEGQRSTGLGCFEMRLVDKKGRLAKRDGGFPPGKLNANSFSLLYPGFSGNERLQKAARYHELTKCVQIDSFEDQGMSINSHHFMQFFIWQVGDIGLAELQTRLRIFCLQALADLIVEFGLMAQPFLEPVSPLPLSQPPGIATTPSRPSSLMRQPVVDQKAYLRKRGSSTIPEVQYGQIITPLNLQVPPSPGLVSGPGPASPNFFNVVPPTIMAMDSPTKNTLSLHSPRHGIFGPKFGFDANTQYSTAWNDVVAGGINRITMKNAPVIPKNTKVTQFATEIPPLPQGQAEYLRMDFISATTSFFYHMERESRAYSDILQSFQKFRFTMDCDHMALTLLRVIYAKFYHSFKTCKDSVVVMKQILANDGSKRLQSINSVETLMGNSVTQDKGHVIDFNEDYSDIDYAILVYNRKHMDEMIHQSMEADSPPVTDLESLSKTPHDSHFHFGPVLQPCFVPRRRLFFLTIRGENVSLFLYNVNPETTVKIKEIVERALYWNNARSRLLREIGLHKMQITHLSTLKSVDPKVNFYQLLTWRDPELLITHDYPPENIKTADFAKIPKKYARMFLKIYRFTDPSYVLKQNTTAKFDDQIAQMLSMREEIKEMLSDFQLFGHYHNLFLNPNAHSKSKNSPIESMVTMDEDVLQRLLTRCEEAHYVQTPLLLFPEWRKKVAAIRAIGTEFGSIGKRKHSAPAKSVVKKQQLSLEPKMKPRSKTVNVTMLPTFSRSSSGEEPCSLKIQFMLAQEYTNYLVKNLGAKRVYIQSTSAETRNNYSTEYTQSTTVSPVVWLYLAYPGGFILLHLSFIEPYFCLRVLFWNRGQLYEDQTIQDLRSFIKEKNQIISKCHLHSFTYDFHLRMVKTYLVGGTQLLFNRGYNTTAFLIDFLQYYSCRPPSARNCIYEENCPFDALKVPGTSVWENFLDKESKYGWKVVRLKNVEKDSSDEFMLVSEASKKVFDQEYEGVRVITNVLKGNTGKEHKLLIRYYVIMVSRDIENPLLDALYAVHDPIPPGEFKRLPTELYPDLELEDEFPLDFGDVAYDSDARQSSGSNSDKSQRHKNRQSMQSIASLASGNNSNDRLSDFDPTFKGYVSPCPSPMSQTLVDFSQMTPLAQPGNFDASELKNKLSSQAMIQKVPPRGHRKNASISSELRIQGAIPPEQVTYVHYFNNLQKKLQHELEEFARASKVELEKLVQQADRECHVEMLWRKLLSMSSINYRKQQTSILTQIGNRLDFNQEPSTLLRHITSTDLNQQQWHTFISIIKTINMEKEEPKLVQIFTSTNYMKLFKFLLLHYEGEKRCRYFDFDDSKNLVITNPNCLNAATLFQYKVAEKKIELLMIIKEHEFRGQQSELFGMNAIHKQFEEIMHCLSSFLWFDLLVRRPNPQRR